ncbi:WD40/YVTN/BNR-like repeat-containing protein [Tabrizicola fusiformis]|uniref:WD40/YVTN/BNR-like repeat-containing protein n=1 Tax=Tabrizicola sp. SY72 TaxID=2741673 RepID=UPI001571F691|nr:sialidase family protein [Tabrizicola sp. SY72]NTT85239.1 exo-alpha-sialidase [Tabrizicola sp. SY72]
MGDGVRVLVGTTKGVFILDGDAARQDWQVSGPLCEGWPINHVIGDPATGTLWAAGGGDWHGAGVFRSTDGGATWALSKLSNGQADVWLAENPEMATYTGMTAAPPAPYTGSVKAIWSLHRAGGILYAGTKPAQLFASHDDGASWTLVQGLSDHPSGPSWEPGGAGLVLHTIISDPSNPAKLWVGISAAGVFATEDGGATWDRRNRRANEATEDDHGACGHDVGFCVHNMVRAPGPLPGADLLYQQNHHGVFRSPDGGRNWVEITQGLPSTFGFPIAVHPADPQTLWVLPLNGDTKGRFPPDAAAKVWRSRDGGANWQALDNGLPGKNCFFTVLRQSMATDRQSPAGVYFGTNSGSVFATADEGDQWTEIARHLPTVLCVEVLEPA